MKNKIYYSKQNRFKIYVALFGSVSFVIISLFLLFVDRNVSNSLIHSNNYLSFTTVIATIGNFLGIKIIGIIGLLFFGSLAFLLIKTITTDKAILKVKPEGIEYASFGLIEWKDIEGFKDISSFIVPFSFSLSQKKWIGVQVKNSDKYINRIDSGFIRLFAKLNKKIYKTPIHIPKTIKMDSNISLINLLEKGLDRFKKQIMN